AGVGGRGGDEVRAGRGRAHRDVRARAEETVTARGPDERRGEVAVLDVGGRRGEAGCGPGLEGGARRGRGDRDRRGGIDGDGDRRPGRLVGAVGGGGGDRVDAGRERAHRDRGAGAEQPVAVGGPRDPRGEGAVLGVGGRAREGDGGPGLERRGRGRGDRDDRRRVDRDGDHGVGGLAAAVGDRGGDGVRAGRERARRDRAARAERAVAARGPGALGGWGGVVVGGGGGAGGGGGGQVVGGVVGGGSDRDGRRRVDRDDDRGVARLAPVVGGRGGEHVGARRERA